MTATRGQIENLVVRIQSDFLDNPTLALTLPAAEKRFGIDEVACVGVLGALVDARVLTEREGAYRRHAARRAAWILERLAPPSESGGASTMSTRDSNVETSKVGRPVADLIAIDMQQLRCLGSGQVFRI